MKKYPSLFDKRKWPEKLNALVVTPGDNKRLYGYSMEEDLARAATLSSLHYLSLVGELPNRQTLRLFEVGMWFASAISIETAASHAAALTRMCGSTTTAVQTVGATSLAEMARVEVAQHDAMVREFLAGRNCAPAPAYDATVNSRMVTALGAKIKSRAVEQQVSRDCLVLLLLAESGIRSSEQLQRALVLARLPVVLAEAFAARSGRFMDDYPVHSPPIEYVEE